MQSRERMVQGVQVDERPTFGSLFAGIGGFDLGLTRAGWRCAWEGEIDAACQRVLDRGARKGWGVSSGSVEGANGELAPGGGRRLESEQPHRFRDVTEVGAGTL